MASADPNFDDDAEHAVMRVSLKAAFLESKRREMELSDFKEKAGKIFVTGNDIYQRAFDYVTRMATLGSREQLFGLGLRSTHLF